MTYQRIWQKQHCVAGVLVEYCDQIVFKKLLCNCLSTPSFTISVSFGRLAFYYVTAFLHPVSLFLSLLDDWRFQRCVFLRLLVNGITEKTCGWIFVKFEDQEPDLPNILQFIIRLS